MRVICVDAKPGKLDGVTPPFKEGEALTVAQGRNPLDYDVIEYGFAGQGWCKYRFIPLSEIDETELVNQKLEAV